MTLVSTAAAFILVASLTVWSLAMLPTFHEPAGKVAMQANLQRFAYCLMLSFCTALTTTKWRTSGDNYVCTWPCFTSYDHAHWSGCRQRRTVFLI